MTNGKDTRSLHVQIGQRLQPYYRTPGKTKPGEKFTKMSDKDTFQRTLINTRDGLAEGYLDAGDGLP
ncbi:MAG TPA: hypothetical protein H9867_09510 [Candidatus Corynebacterium gallistercoris]|uniref:Uncharacterized protein n=1 Tax=Candidatus Corynebacterium gallistercoris TaxID=2838530 RepID=A0A9D1S022_9CORY|nr:hypothetical protein [Candidatus Corynebacterium gallistercoris]